MRDEPPQIISERITELHCPHCGHDVSIVPTRRCPECGQIFDRGSLLHDAATPPLPLWRLAALVMCLPIAFSSWIVLAIWALGWGMSSVFLAPAAGLSGIFCIFNSAIIAKTIASQIQRRGHAAGMSPQSLANLVAISCITLQFVVLGLGVLVGRLIAR